MVVKYSNRPLEFYDARTGVFLREMVTNPPSFSCIDWTPNHGRHKTPKVVVRAIYTLNAAYRYNYSAADLRMREGDSLIPSP